MRRTCHSLGYILLALAAGAIAALLFPIWLITALLGVIVILLGVALICGS